MGQYGLISLTGRITQKSNGKYEVFAQAVCLPFGSDETIDLDNMPSMSAAKSFATRLLQKHILLLVEAFLAS
jgi:hypothetical protein